MKEIQRERRARMQYVDGIVTDNGFVQEIEEEIQKVKRKEGERVNYMTFEMKMMEERKEGHREGLREGLRRGHHEGLREGLQRGHHEGLREGQLEGQRKGQQDERVAILRRLVTQSQIPVEQALDLIGIPVVERPSYKELLHAAQEQG